MSNYTAEFQPFYENGWEDKPSENTPIKAVVLNEYDATFLKIEEFIANLDLSGLGGDYALLSEAGCSISGSVASDTGFLTVNLLNKAGQTISTKTFYLPFGQLFKYATFENGVIKFKYFSGVEYNMDISSLIDGLVPTTRTIAGVDLKDDITEEELRAALGIDGMADALSLHMSNTSNPHGVNKEQVGLGNVDNTSDLDKPVSSATQEAIDGAYASSNAYTDQKIADLINGAPTTLDTLKEVADAMAENESVVEALEASIGSKASQAEVDTHVENNNIHITPTERTNWNAAKTHADSAHAPSNAEANQNAFSNVKVGNTTIVADTTTDTLTIAAGDNVTITLDATNNKVTIAAKDTVYTHPSHTAKPSGLYKVTIDSSGHVSAATEVTKNDITAMGVSDSDHSHNTIGEGEYVAKMQSDGNLVVYKDDSPVWASSSPLNWPCVTNVENGTTEITPSSANVVTSIQVTFSKTFTAIPKVVATPQTSVPNACFASVTNISKTGFKLHLYRGDTNATSIHWIAMAT